MSEHPEWTKTNSLTSPADRGDGKYKSDMSAQPLTEEQVQAAVQDLVISSNLAEKYPHLERQFADPPIPLQTYSLVSFVPAKGATPDKDGFYGFAKVRGTYASPQEAVERSEFLIRNVDSYHQIYTAYTGRPFPLTNNPKYAETIKEVDIKKKAVEVISEDVKAKRDKEKAEMEEIKEREKRLLDQTKPDFVPDPYEQYTVLKVKKAQTMKQLEKMKESIIKTREQIKELDEQNPEFSKEYFERYMKARRDAGIPDEHNTEENFVKYMVEDIDLGF
jgi:hypothetical protein